MSIEIKAPTFPESVADGTVATWHKKPGEPVQRDELLVDIETDKVVLEVVAPANGTLKNVLKEEGDVVLSDEVLAVFVAGDVAAPAAEAEAPAAAEPAAASGDVIMSPAARKIAEENGVAASAVTATGKDGRVTKEDVVNHLKAAPKAAPAAAPAPAKTPAPAAKAAVVPEGERIEKRVPMTRLRATIARRLVDAQQNAAMLTTYNEVNMKPVMDLRAKYKDQFEKVHGVKLGFMSFFVKAATEALKRFPAVNASIDGNDMVYHGYQDIGTFTITNGGTFGSLMSTPILNPPQTAIMGMHKIQERPMAVNGQVVILPMMYLALSYDHRMIDGKEAVQFLVAIKDLLEDPARLLLDI